MMNLPRLNIDRTAHLVAEGALLIDLRPPDDYLRMHLRGSICLMFEDGPGFSGRGRDLIPLDRKLILVDDDATALDLAAAMLRSRGFDVIGATPEVRHWPQEWASHTEIFDLDQLPKGRARIDVGDPGVKVPEGTRVIPVELLWSAAADLDSNGAFAILGGWGVRAAAAVGILESLGFSKVCYAHTLPVGSQPRTASQNESTMFRVDGRQSP